MSVKRVKHENGNDVIGGGGGSIHGKCNQYVRFGSAAKPGKQDPCTFSQQIFTLLLQ